MARTPSKARRKARRIRSGARAKKRKTTAQRRAIAAKAKRRKA